MRKLLFLLIIVLLAVVTYRVASASPTLEVVKDEGTGLQQNTFDPQNCQYPERSTNTPTTCDNSDPCDPANVRGASGACETPVVQQEEEVTPIQENAIMVGK